MATIVRNSFAKSLWPGVNSFYGKSYDEWPLEYTQIFDKYTDSRAYLEDVGTSGFGLAVVKPEGESITYDTAHQSWVTRYVHVVYSLGFNVSREAFDDDLYKVVAPKRAQELAFSMRQTEETVCANVLNRGHNSSYTGGDSVELFSAVHPNWAGGTWQNEPTTATDISEAALEQACIDIGDWKNDRGLKIALYPTKLIIPRTLEFEAYRILKSPYQAATANNDVNALNAMGKLQDVCVNHYLTDTDAWYLKTNLKNDGFKYIQRRPMEFGIDNDFDTENAKFKGSIRISCGWTDPRAGYASPGA